MTRIVVLGGGFGERDAVVEVFGPRFSRYLAWLFWNALHLLKRMGFRKQMQAAIDWSLVQFFPRASAIVRPTPRCSICQRAAHGEEQRAA